MPKFSLLDVLPSVFLFARRLSLADLANCAAFAFLAAFTAITQ
jgi:hypothetical protein